MLEALEEAVSSGVKTCRCMQGPWEEDVKKSVYGIQVFWKDGRCYECRDVDTERENVQPLIERILTCDMCFEDLPFIVEDYVTELYWPLIPG